MRPRSWFRTLVLCGGLLGSAITQANSMGQVTTPTVLTEASAAAFVQECVEAWSKRDDAMWDQIVDFALFPAGALPIMLRDGKEPDVDLWVTSFSELAQWLKVNPVGDVAKSMQVVANIEDQKLRDLRGRRGVQGQQDCELLLLGRSTERGAWRHGVRGCCHWVVQRRRAVGQELCAGAVPEC